MRGSAALLAVVLEDELDEEIVSDATVLLYFVWRKGRFLETQVVVSRVNEGRVESEPANQRVGHHATVLDQDMNVPDELWLITIGEGEMYYLFLGQVVLHLWATWDDITPGSVN